MSFLQEKIDLETHISANLTGISLVFENQSQRNDANEWVRVNILNADSKQISLGDNPYYRYIGLLIFQIFIKPNIGSGRTLQLCDQITNMFRGTTLHGMTFSPPTTDIVGEQGGWFQVNVSTKFSREEV